MNQYNRNLPKNIINNANYIRSREVANQTYQRDLITRNSGITYQREQNRLNNIDSDTLSHIGLSNFAEEDSYENTHEETGEIEGSLHAVDTHSNALAAATAVTGAEHTLEHITNPVPVHGAGTPSTTSINDIPSPSAQSFSRDQEAKDTQTAIDIAGTVGGIITTALL